MRVHDNTPVGRNWGQADQVVKDRVARLEQSLRAGPPMPPPGESFEEIRVRLGEPDATDGEIHQAALDAGLTVGD